MDRGRVFKGWRGGENRRGGDEVGGGGVKQRWEYEEYYEGEFGHGGGGESLLMLL